MNPRFLGARALRAALSCAVVLAAIGAAHAADPATPMLRIGFVDTQRILQDSALAKRESQQLQQEFEPRSAHIKALAQQVAAQRKKLQDDALVMSDDQRIAEQAQLTELSQRLRDAQQSFAEDLDAKRNADVQGLLDKANAVVTALARQRKLDIVFQSAVYVDPRVDMTAAVIQALDAANPSNSH